MSINPTAIDHFRSIIKEGEDGNCWPWPQYIAPHGYGTLTVGRQTFRSNRLAWTAYRDVIPHGMLVLHRCDNPACCNPNHLFLGTDADNMTDKVRKGRHQNGCRKIEDATKDEIRRHRAEGSTYDEIADRFGISKSVAWNTVHKGETRTKTPNRSPNRAQPDE